MHTYACTQKASCFTWKLLTAQLQTHWRIFGHNNNKSNKWCKIPLQFSLKQNLYAAASFTPQGKHICTHFFALFNHTTNIISPNAYTLIIWFHTHTLAHKCTTPTHTHRRKSANWFSYTFPATEPESVPPLTRNFSQLFFKAHSFTVFFVQLFTHWIIYSAELRGRIIRCSCDCPRASANRLMRFS
jgi:hypothetical protein